MWYRGRIRHFADNAGRADDRDESLAEAELAADTVVERPRSATT